VNAKDAAKEAIAELDFRVAKAGKEPPQGGWKLSLVRDEVYESRDYPNGRSAQIMRRRCPPLCASGI